MASDQKNKRQVSLTTEQERALRITKKTVTDVAQIAHIKDISEYSQTEHYYWRHWAERGKQPSALSNEPSSSWAIFKEDLPHDVILKIQVNYFFGAFWTELSLLPLSIVFLRLWRQRLSQEDASGLFNIKSPSDYEASVDILTSRLLQNYLLLLPVMLYDTLDQVPNFSVEGFIKTEVKPYFRKHWQALGIPKNFILLPELHNEIEERRKESEKFKKRWLGITPGGFRDKKSLALADRDDFAAIISFINHTRLLWKYVTKFFAMHHYDEDCIQWVKGKKEYKELSAGINVPIELLKKVFKREHESALELEPLGLAIEHARKKFDLTESPSTVRRHFTRANPTNQHRK